MSSTPGMHTYAEIQSQGEVWQKVLESAEDQIKAVEGWQKQEHDEVIFTGCGSTHYLALSAAKIWTALTGESARGLPASEIWLYGDSCFSRMKPLLAAVSRSGETTETLKAIEAYQARYTDDPLVISCYPASSMAKAAGTKLLAPQAGETSVAQTRSFSSMYLLAQLLAGYTANDAGFVGTLGKIPGLFAPVIGRYETLIQQIAYEPKYQHFVFLGSGIFFGLASEVMLKMKEMSTSLSEAFHFMEFRHGPMSVINDRSLVIGLVSDTRQAEELKVLQDMQALGASTMALVNNASGVRADHVIEMDAPISEIARSILDLPVLQLLAYHHSLSKGLNPDQPTNLTSVVYL